MECYLIEKGHLHTGISEIDIEIMDLKFTQIGVFHPSKFGLRDFTLFEIRIMGLHRFWTPPVYFARPWPVRPISLRSVHSQMAEKLGFKDTDGSEKSLALNPDWVSLN